MYLKNLKYVRPRRDKLVTSVPPIAICKRKIKKKFKIRLGQGLTVQVGLWLNTMTFAQWSGKFRLVASYPKK